MSKIRNFYFASKEAPLFYMITKTQLFTMVGFSIIPGFWAFYNLNAGTNPFLTLFSGILFLTMLFIGYLVSSYKIDGRNVFKFIIDKRREKVSLKQERKKVPGTDINKLLDSIKE